MAGYGRSPSTGIVIKAPSGSIIDHAAVLLQVDDKRRDQFGATNLVGAGYSDPVREYPFAASGIGITSGSGDLNAGKVVTLASAPSAHPPRLAIQ